MWTSQASVWILKAKRTIFLPFQDSACFLECVVDDSRLSLNFSKVNMCMVQCGSTVAFSVVV
jgi:hypothetical protein